MSVWAILVAGGRGERLGLEQPKAFAKLGEDPLLAEPLRRLDDSGWIDAIVVVVPAGWEEPAILLAEELGCGKVRACGRGGGGRGGWGGGGGGVGGGGGRGGGAPRRLRACRSRRSSGRCHRSPRAR